VTDNQARPADARPGGPQAAPRVPVGTQVVLRSALPAGSGTAQRGATGRVVEDGTAGYVVRLADGRTVLAARAQLALRKHHQADLSLPAPRTDPHILVERHTILAVVVGSRAFGLDTDGSDTDTRGVYQAPTAWFWSLTKPPSHVDGPGAEWFSWEVERFCELALRANPGCLEVLYSPGIVRVTDTGEQLRALRRAFLSQLVFQTYNGYVLSQFKKLEGSLRRDGVPRWKHVMHLLRLLLAAGDLLRTGELAVHVGPHRDRLLAIRGGAVPWDEVEAWRLRLHAELDAALAATVLPAAPDVDAVDRWLRGIRAASARGEPT
jgi:hypothetical protein